jgi:hypothetical protein
MRSLDLLAASQIRLSLYWAATISSSPKTLFPPEILEAIRRQSGVARRMDFAMPKVSLERPIDENASLRGGGWQRHLGEDLGGKTLGLLGLGNIGSAVATISSSTQPIYSVS